MSKSLVSDLLSEIYRIREPRSLWRIGQIAKDLSDKLEIAVTSQLQVDLADAISEQRLAYASSDNLTYPKDIQSAHELWSAGNTAILQSLQTDRGVLNSLCAALEVAEGRRVGCSAYVSSPKAESFALHTDDWDAFIIQLQGEKTFWVDDPGSINLVSVQLSRGSALYLPRHTKHRAHSNTGSLHISINFLVFPARLTL